MDLKKITEEKISTLAAVFNAIEEKASNKSKQKLENLHRAIDTVSLNYRDVFISILTRQELTEKQCKNETFFGQIHEQYHDACSNTHKDIENLFVAIKRCLNILPQFIYSVMPHEHQKNIRDKSFGAFLNSIKKIKIEDKKLTELLTYIYKEGKSIDSEINTYRDKYIEHPRGYDEAGILTDSSGVRRLHIKSGEKSDKQNKKIKDQMHPNPWLKLQMYKGGYVYLIHIEPNTDNIVGQKVKEGQKIGYVSDGNSGHFDKYGPHYHYFFSPNTEDAVLKKSIPRNGVNELSPEPTQAYLKIIDYLINSTQQINNYL